MRIPNKIQKHFQIDELDRGILDVLQQDCKTPLVKIGEHVGLSAPAVIERIRKLEEAGIIRGYHALLDSRQVGLDVTAFVGVTNNYLKGMGQIETTLQSMPEVLEVHHVTGDHSMLLKVRSHSTMTLEHLLARIRAIVGVERTHTMIVLSSMFERVTLPLNEVESDEEARLRRKG